MGGVSFLPVLGRRISGDTLTFNRKSYRRLGGRERQLRLLSAVYEVDFLGFSYGFRLGRNPHQALAALHEALMSQRVCWVLDVDIRKFFDSVDHEWLLRMIAHRIHR